MKPIDPSKGNGILFYNINNRGNRNFPFNNGDPGDGFVQEEGYTLLWSGWQGAVLKDGSIDLPGAPLSFTAGPAYRLQRDAQH